jgi:tripartite-type tricarboxylate transporter receptor subunit TctC
MRRGRNSAEGAAARRGLFACLLVAISTTSMDEGARAQPVEPAESFFKGKTVTLLIGGTAGGGLDTVARIFSRFATRHIPGNPTVTPQLMPGAGGIRVIDTLATAAPKDGTTIAVVPAGPLVEPLVGGRKMAYRMTDLVALGAWTKDFSLCAAWHASGFRSLADARSREMTVAGTGAASTTDTFPLVLNAAIGTRFKVITGYLGTQETIMAVERGETHGRCGWSWSSLKATKLDWLKEGKIHLLLQMGAEKSPLFPDVPFAPDLAKSPEDRQILALMFKPLSLSNAFLAPPGLPAQRVADLRAAFVATLADKDLVAEAMKAMKEEPSPTNGQAMQAILAQMYATPEPVVARLRGVLKK